MKVRFFALVTACLFMTGFAKAQSTPSIYTGNDLMRWVDSYEKTNTRPGTVDDYMNVSLFQGYVSGISDLSQFNAKICQPNGVAVKQLIAITTRELRAAPEDWTLPAPYFVIKALTKSFPCSVK